MDWAGWLDWLLPVGAGYLPYPPRESKPIVVASRASKLAQIQTNIALDALRRANPGLKFETAFMSTEGDKNQTQALYLVGGKAFWTKELEVALLEEQVDILVHSLKDVPTTLPDGCELGAILEREDPYDCLVVKHDLSYRSLAELPPGSVVGTSSVRRVAQLRRRFPHLTFQDVRGNLNTRLAKLDAADGPYTAIILAKAGLLRLGFDARITCDLHPPTLYYAVGQAAIGVEIRSNDKRMKTIADRLTHWQTAWMCRAERACLRVLEGGCSVPVGVHTTLDVLEEGECLLTLTATVTSLNGQEHVEETVVERVESVEAAEATGEKIARLLISSGGRAILDEITRERSARNTQ